MNVLSLFDGMSGTQLALKKLGIKVDNYYASEIDKYAIKVTQANFPNTKQLGDVTKLCFDVHIDLLVMGSPCQDLSFASRDKKGLEGERSGLFFEGLRLVKACLAINPDLKILVENVRMTKANQDRMTKALSDVMGQVIEPVAINSNIFSAQNRYRLYWTNLNIPTLPSDKGIVMNDILEDGFSDRDKSHCLDANYFKGGNLKSYFEKNRRQLKFSDSSCKEYSKLSVIECERLQTVPDNYTNHVSNTQRYKMLGNGFTIDTICHILTELK
jgi:site-specific DNA-cytosine methylase